MARSKADMKHVSSFLNSEVIINYFNDKFRPINARELTLADVKKYDKINRHFKSFFRYQGT